MLLASEMNIRILLFPEGHDPDSFVRAHPQEYVEKFIAEQAQDFIDFKAAILLKDAGADPIKKAEAIRDIVKSVAAVANVLKQEVYLKEVATKFDLSERTLFNELNVQKQIHQQQPGPSAQPAPPKPTMEVVAPEAIQTLNPLLELEEKLVKHMLNYGDRVLNRKDAEDQPYQTTVIEEIVRHLEEDDYPVQSPVNQVIIDELKKGLQENTIIGSNFFLTLMDEQVVSKVSSAIMEDNPLGDWARNNIFPPSPGDKLEAEIEDDMLIHKSHYIEKLIYEKVQQLQECQDQEEQYNETLKMIMVLKTLLNEINRKLSRQLTKGHSFFKEQKL